MLYRRKIFNCSFCLLGSRNFLCGYFLPLFCARIWKLPAFLKGLISFSQVCVCASKTPAFGLGCCLELSFLEQLSRYCL